MLLFALRAAQPGQNCGIAIQHKRFRESRKFLRNTGEILGIPPSLYWLHSENMVRSITVYPVGREAGGHNYVPNQTRID